MLLQKKNVKNVMPFLWDELCNKAALPREPHELNLSIKQIGTALKRTEEKETEEIRVRLARNTLAHTPRDLTMQHWINMIVPGLLLAMLVSGLIILASGTTPLYAFLSYFITYLILSTIVTYRRTRYGKFCYGDNMQEADFNAICVLMGITLPLTLEGAKQWWQWRIRRALHTPLNTKTLASADKKIRAIKKKLKAIDEIAEETDDSRLKMVQTALKAEIRKKEEEAERMLLDMLTSIEKRRKHIFAHANSIWPCKAAQKETAKRARVLKRMYKQKEITRQERKRKAIKEVERIALALDNGNAKETQDLSLFIAIAEMRREAEEA